MTSRASSVFTVLQVSDLHRAEDAPVSNELLLSCLLSDIEKHLRESPRISKCDLIVVTGDLVAGAMMDGDNALDPLKRQYGQAKEFLLRLGKELLNGDLRRLFIVPGNHDVSWPESKRSMEKVAGSSDVLKTYGKRNSQYRWSWKEQAMYRIKNREQYAQRLSNFKEFFDDFYQTLDLTFSLQDGRQALNFLTPDKRALFTGFSSIYENDCFNRPGRISVDDVAANNLRIRASTMNEIPLKIAFWHHGVEGAGYDEDHLNSFEVLPHLIDRGYALGLHGHQHKSGVISYAYSLNPKLVMPIIGCGSLCAGPYDIPPGYRRQYNVIEIDDANARIRVHVREWFEDTIWAPARLQEFGGKSCMDIDMPILQEVLQTSKQKINGAAIQAIKLGEASVRAKDYDSALTALASAPRDILLVRKLLIESFQMLGRWPELIDLIGNPTNSDELTLIVDALTKVKDFPKAERILKTCSNEPGIYDRILTDELRKRVDAERKDVTHNE